MYIVEISGERGYFFIHVPTNLYNAVYPNAHDQI